MKIFVALICSLLITSIIVNDDGAERQRRAADARMTNNYSLDVRRAT